jgi:ribosomal protein L11 methyltransferase
LPWIQLTLDCRAAEAFRLSDLLSEAGAVSVSLTEAKDEVLIENEPGTTALWQATRVRGLFAEDADVAALNQRLRQAGFTPPRVTPLEDRDWERAWQQHVPPRRYGRRLWVVPSFTQRPPGGGVCVRLDPGLAFGTGNHATTALCLEWLADQALDGLDIIDYGCGSGILAIAAVKLGARAARAVDNDPKALETARENARLNRCLGRIRFHSPESLPSAPADVLVANIFANPLISLSPDLAQLVRPSGRIVLSGILATQAEAVSTAYAAWFKMSPAAERDQWVRIAGERRPAGS